MTYFVEVERVRNRYVSCCDTVEINEHSRNTLNSVLANAGQCTECKPLVDPEVTLPCCNHECSVFLSPHATLRRPHEPCPNLNSNSINLDGQK